jgi:hypothetical protein
MHYIELKHGERGECGYCSQKTWKHVLCEQLSSSFRFGRGRRGCMVACLGSMDSTWVGKAWAALVLVL